jgi:predicted HTH transcriptional regulator
VLEELAVADLDKGSIDGYRSHFAALKPTHIWNRLDDESFLHKIGASGRSTLGHLKPTLAGLLMFGTDDVITRILPDYFLDYREIYDFRRWTDRVVSNLGEWSGNIFDFFFKVVNKLTADVKVPFRLYSGVERVSETPVHEALREALANAVIHADYYGRQGVVVEKRPDKIIISNPGIFRPNKEDVFNGGVSDPRNPNIFKMFALLDIGERAGSGLFNIRTIWREESWPTPVWEETFTPERLRLSIPIEEEKIGVAEHLEKYHVANSRFKPNRGRIWEIATERVGEKAGENARSSATSSDKVGENAKNSATSSGKVGENAKSSATSSDKVGENAKSSAVDSGKLDEKVGEKITANQQKIMDNIAQNPYIAAPELSLAVGISKRKIEVNIAKLKVKGLLERVGPDKGGHWRVKI